MSVASSSATRPTLFGPASIPASESADKDSNEWAQRVLVCIGRCLPGDGVPQHMLLGMTVRGMRAWVNSMPHADAIAEANFAGATQMAPDFRPAREFNGYVALHAASREGQGRSVCEGLLYNIDCEGQLAAKAKAEYIGPASVYVSWALSTSMATLLDGLDAYLARHPSLNPNKTFFWVSVLSMRPPLADAQQPSERGPVRSSRMGGRSSRSTSQSSTQAALATVEPGSGSATKDHELDVYLKHVKALIGMMDQTVVVCSGSWQSSTFLNRAHCLHEIACSRAVELTMARELRESFEAAYTNDIGSVRALLDRMTVVDVRQASCKRSRDHKSLLRLAVPWRGADPIDGPNGGMAKYNAQIRATLRLSVSQQGRLMLLRIDMQKRGKSRLIDSLGIVSCQVEVDRSTDQHGPKHEKTLSALNNLAVSLKRQGHLEASAPIYRSVLETRRALLGDKHPQTLISMNNLGAQLYAQGNINEASLLMYEAYEKRKAALGADHLSTLVSASNLGNLFKQQGDFLRATGLLESALEGRRKQLGPINEQTLRAMNNLASLHYEKGEVDKAEVLYREALDSSRAGLGHAHALTMTSMSNLGNLLHTRGYRRKTHADLHEAYPLLHEAVQASVEALGAEHIQTLISRSNLGACLRTMGREEEASSLIRAAVEGIAEHRKQMGDGHPNAGVLDSGMEQLEV